jgi:transcriptional regulator with XRE-family HTH domain
MSEQSSYHIPEWTAADRLRKARVEAHLTQGQLADRIGVDKNTIGNYETGATTNLRRIVLNAWAVATGVPYSWLATGETGGGPTGGGSERGNQLSAWNADVIQFPAPVQRCAIGGDNGEVTSLTAVRDTGPGQLPEAA